MSNPRGVKELDSLINTSYNVALNKSDYNRTAINKFNFIPSTDVCQHTNQILKIYFKTF